MSLGFNVEERIDLLEKRRLGYFEADNNAGARRIEKELNLLEEISYLRRQNDVNKVKELENKINIIRKIIENDRDYTAINKIGEVLNG